MMKSIEKSIKKITLDTQGKQLDFTLLFVVLILLCIGLIVLSSASSYYALTQFNDSSYYLKRQMFFAIIGIVCMIIISKIDYKIYNTKIGYLLYYIGIGLMLLVFVPGIGGETNGANRWLNVGFTRFQPSEIMKLFLIIGIATYMDNNQKKLRTIKGYFIPVVMTLVICIIMYFQSHMSGMIVMLMISSIVILINGIKIKKRYIIITLFAVIIIAAVFLASDGYRWERVTSFLHPEEDTRGSNWQPVQSLYAIGTGGFFRKRIGPK